MQWTHALGKGYKGLEIPKKAESQLFFKVD